jgi:soluble P-type ATPase
LNDQNIAQEAYTDIAKNPGNDPYYRIQAAKALIDQNIAQEAYADIAKNGGFYAVRSVIDLLTNQEVLTYITNGDAQKYVKEVTDDVARDYTITHTLDLRKEAHKRLAKLQGK